MSSLQKQASKRQQQYRRYLDFYHFERDPFLDEGVVGLFYSGAERRKMVEALLHFSRYGSAPLLLTGGEGVGKSSVLFEFSRNVAADVEVVIVKATLLLSQNQLLANIMDDLQIPYHLADNQDYFLSLKQWIVEQSKRNRQIVICIDDAHNLSVEFIQPIVELLDDLGDTLKIIFVGEPETNEMLGGIVEKQNILLNTLELPVFTQQQVAEYVSYRLHSVGYHGDFPLTDLQLQAATLRSRGSVRHLNDQIREMLIAAIDGDHFMRSKFPFLHSTAVFALLMLILFLWQRSEAPVMSHEPAPILLEGATFSASVETIDLVNTHESKANEASGLPVKDDKGFGEVTSALAEMPATTVIAAQELTTSAKELVAAASEEVRAEKPPKTILDTKASISEAKKLKDSATAANDEQHLNNKISDPQMNGSMNPVHQRLLAWPQLSYALQVFGTHNPQRARSLIEKYFGATDLLFYETRHNGKPWYVVINGPYTGRESAQQAIERLPESLQRLRPWPRNVASIKSDIQRYALLLQAQEKKKIAN